MLRARSWWWLFMALVLAGGCQCGDPGTGGARGGFRPQTEAVDFGRVLEGTQERRSVTLVATGRASTPVTASVTGGGPFTVVTSQVTVPGSGTATVDVLFTAGNGPAEGVLVLTAGSTTASVPLAGLGVRPLPCLPSGECRESRFDLASGTCIETPQADGATCIPSSRCQENGRCQAGACVGTPRTCDDDNPCTVDACSPTEGCVNSDVVCPVPRNPCKVGVCDRNQGCTEEDAEDYTACGAVDCKNANVCFLGTCRELPTPEGFVCAPATPCQGEGTCAAGECVRPDAGDLAYTFRQELGGEPVAVDGGPVLLVQGNHLLASVCGGDAGCRLVSYTPTGLLRFESPYPDGGARTLVAASDGGVVVLAPDALESYALTGGGARQWESPLTVATPGDAGAEGLVPGTGVGRVALTPEGDVLAYVAWSAVADAGLEDGGVDGGAVPELEPEPRLARLVLLRGDGGTVVNAGPVEPWRGEARLALDEAGQAYLFTREGRLAGTALTPVDPDGGVPSLDLDLLGDGVPDGGASLALAAGRLLVGARAFTDTDGGVLGALDWDGGTRSLTPLPEPVLMSPAGTGYAFALACGRRDGTPCPPEEQRVVLRAFNPDDGKVAWEVDVLPFEDWPGALHEASLVRGGLVSVLADAEQPDGRQVWLEFFALGERVGMCPLPGRPRVAGAVFAGSALNVVLERDGVWLLESYALQPGLETESRGWPQRHGGASGARRSVP